MKKLLLSLSLGLLVAGSIQAQTVIYSENFNATTGTALPSGWSINPNTTTSWKSGTAQDLSSQSFGFPEDDGRLVAINDDGEGQTADNSNALLESKSYDLTGQSGVYLGVDIYFAAGTYQGATESLTIEASTDGGTTWNVLQTVAANQYTFWDTRYVDLSSLSGQSNVKIGFRYSDGGGWLFGAALDNFKLFIPPAHDIELTGVAPIEGSPAAYGAVNASISISGAIKNNGVTPISSYNVNYQQGNNPVVTTAQTASPAIGIGQMGTFDNVNYTIPSVGNFPIKVWVTVPGDNIHANDSADAYVQGVSTVPTKRLVFEEATGTWCGWCPRGSVKMEEFAGSNSGVAAQISVHNQDPMTVPAYDALLGGLVNHSYPNISVDRTFLGDPGDIDALYEQYKDNFGFADVSLGNVDISGNNVTVPVTITPSVALNGAKLALVVTESNVHGPDNTTDTTWAQHNYYTANANGAMGGYESQPEFVFGLLYHFVARSISPSPSGAASGLPASMNAGTPYNATLTTTLDPSWDPNNLQYIVELLDANGNILNSNFTDLPVLTPSLSTVVGITDVHAGIDKASLYPNPAKDLAYLTVNAREAYHATLSVTDVMGRVVSSTITTNLNQGSNTIQIPTSELTDGTYFINLNTGKGNLVFKLQVVK